MRSATRTPFHEIVTNLSRDVREISRSDEIEGSGSRQWDWHLRCHRARARRHDEYPIRKEHGLIDVVRDQEACGGCPFVNLGKLLVEVLAR
jgi:hypothetical protein